MKPIVVLFLYLYLMHNATSGNQNYGQANNCLVNFLKWKLKLGYEKLRLIIILKILKLKFKKK